MDAAHARSLIEQRQRELREMHSELEFKRDEQDDVGALSSADQHPAELGTETEDREASLSILELIDAELRDLEQALVRLDQGTYGRCEVCGREISEERLAAFPGARRCVEHQAAAELL